ncbi:MAG: DegT/DnrJ/EryC1/StrS family aminotransferase [Alphaproteobacteria bacterium]|nr:DegT/DnrJ/EryC1/StrS family aminotransferase [Alphaproteobacteria bacterium]
MKHIKLSSAYFGEEEATAVARVLRTQVVNMGTEVKAFEKELHAFFGRPEAEVTCVHSGTAALLLTAQSCGISAGDEVLVPTLTFISTFQAIKATGAIPIPCDIDLDDGFISLEDAERRLTSRTKAIVPVLYAGCSSKIHKVYEFAKSHNLKVIEDAAHCFGDETIAQRDGVLCFSFDPIKNISCGDGGCVLTTQHDVTERLKDLRLLGVIGDTEKRFKGLRSWDADVKEQGWRLHMNNIAAAIGRAQLAKFPEIRALRQRNARLYIEGLVDIDELQLLPINAKTAVPHIFPVLVKDGHRNELRQFLQEQGVETGVQYKPNHLLSYFNMGYSLPNAEKFYAEELSLPVHPLVSAEDVGYVIDCIKRFFGNIRK